MKLRTMIFRKGIFTRLSDDRTGVNAHNYDELMLYRKVLDEMVIAAIGTNTSAKDHSYRWFNSKPGDVDFFVADRSENGYIEGVEYKVDMHNEFCEVCSLANLDPTFVRESFNRMMERIKKEDGEDDRHKSITTI